jgi:tetratricopeptide (TPR) repeat protein
MVALSMFGFASASLPPMNRNPTLPGGVAPQQALARSLAGAVEYLKAGRLEEAVRTLESSGLALRNPVGRNILGDIRLKQGNPTAALKAFDAAIKLAPAFPEAHCNRGVALQELGRLEEALAAEERALRHRPGYATANYNRGNILRDLGRLDEAVAAFDLALRDKPAHAEARLNRGMALLDRNRFLEALDDFRRARTLRPDLIAAYVGEASALRRLGKREDAMAAIDAALAVEAGNGAALVVKARFLMLANKFDAALESIDRAIASDAANAVPHALRSSLLVRLRRYDEALTEADEAVRLAPKEPQGHAARAVVLYELGRVDEQLEALKTAERLGAANADFYHAQATGLAERGDLAAAVASFEKAIELEPEAAVIHFHFGMLLLYLGDFARGWVEHEWRLNDAEYKDINKASFAPNWRGEALAGKKLLVKKEQGNGDNVQFARFLPEIAARGAAVTLTVPSPLKAMFQRAFPMVDVTDRLGVRSGFDFQVALMSLPAVIGVDAERLPQGVPYLFADEAMIAHWRARLGDYGFKVGVVWQGNPKFGRDASRSIPLRHFQPLAAIPGVRLISLQAINGLDQLDDLPAGMAVESYGAEVANNPDGFNQIAAMMANLDLIVSSDTVTAHLAGALARPVWVALSYRPDWRWLEKRPDSPWYPTMRLFRQQRPGDWPGVFASIAAALAEQVKSAA